MQDISARKQIEQELRELNDTLEQRVEARTSELQQANDDLRAFAYSVSHDLRTPLRSMQGLAQALLDGHAAQLDEAGQEYVRRIAAASARMDCLTVELLEYNQLLHSQLTFERVSVVLVIHEVIGQLRRDPLFPADADITVYEPLPWVLRTAQHWLRRSRTCYRMR